MNTDTGPYSFLRVLVTEKCLYRGLVQFLKMSENVSKNATVENALF
jgi:hypothetical protein